MIKYIFLLGLVISTNIIASHDIDDNERRLGLKQALFKEKFFFNPRAFPSERPARISDLTNFYKLKDFPLQLFHSKGWENLPFMKQTHFLLIEFPQGWATRDQHTQTFVGSSTPEIRCHKKMNNGDFICAVSLGKTIVSLRYGYEISPSDFEKSEKIYKRLSKIESLEFDSKYLTFWYSQSCFEKADIIYKNGLKFRDLQAFSQAIREFEKALVHLENEDSEEGLKLKVKILHNLGSVTFQKKKYFTSKSYFEEATKVHQEAFEDSFAPSDRNLEKLNRRGSIINMEDHRSDYEIIIFDIL